MSARRVASVRNRIALSSSLKSVQARALALAAFTCHSCQSVGMDSRVDEFGENGSGPRPGKPGSPSAASPTSARIERFSPPIALWAALPVRPRTIRRRPRRAPAVGVLGLGRARGRRWLHGVRGGLRRRNVGEPGATGGGFRTRPASVAATPCLLRQRSKGPAQASRALASALERRLRCATLTRCRTVRTPIRMIVRKDLKDPIAHYQRRDRPLRPNGRD